MQMKGFPMSTPAAAFSDYDAIARTVQQYICGAGLEEATT